jgi:cold shock CspA family protein
MRIDGTLKSWNDDRGFGFIEPSLGGQEIFVHIKAFETRFGRPQIGQRLTFEIEMSAEGKKRAKRVQPVQVAPSTSRKHIGSPAQWGTASYFAIPAFLRCFPCCRHTVASPKLGSWVCTSRPVSYASSRMAMDKSAATSWSPASAGRDV